MKTRNSIFQRLLGLLSLAVVLALTLGSVRAETLYVANFGDNTVAKFTSGGVGSVFLTGALGLGAPTGLAFDSAGNLFVANHIQSNILKFTPGGSVSVFASSHRPRGIAFDSAGNLFVANFVANTIRKITPGGISSLVFFGAPIHGPYGLAFDSTGNLFVSSILNHTIVKITPGGDASIFADASQGINGPRGLTFDSAGNLFVANISDHTILKFTPAGVGSVHATSASGLNGPADVRFDSAGNLFVANWNDNSIRKITPGGVSSLFASTPLNRPGFIVLSVDNQSPTVSCPPAATIACTSFHGATATVTASLADADNDGLTVTWSVNSVPVATHNLAAGATNDSLINHFFGFGTQTVSVSVTDGNSAPVTCETTVTVTAVDAPVPHLASLPTITGECSASIAESPTAADPCAAGGVVTGSTTDATNYTAQGTYTITWSYTSPHDATLVTTQPQTVIVKDITPPTIACPPDVSVAYGAEPAAATTVAAFLAQGGTISDNCDPNGTVSSFDTPSGICPTVIARTYMVTDAAGNGSSCEQIITVNNLFAEDGIIWHQPLARSGMSEDTDPGAGNTLKYRFKLGSTIPIKVHAQGCSTAVTANANVAGRVVVFGDTDMDGVIDANEVAIDINHNGAGETGGVMDKINGHLKYNLNTKSLPPTFKCYILQVTVTDSSTGESRVEIVPLQAK